MRECMSERERAGLHRVLNVHINQSGAQGLGLGSRLKELRYVMATASYMLLSLSMHVCLCIYVCLCVCV